MAVGDPQQLVASYADWLKQGLSAESVTQGHELTTPFLDRHNDHLQIYAEEREGSILLSDDGYTIQDLRENGIDVQETPKRVEILNSTLRAFGVKLEGHELVIRATERTLGQRIHSLVQAMLAVNDMYVMAQWRVAGFFFEDVRAYLEQHDVRFVERVKVPGRAYDHTIDFVIPRSRQRPERYVQAVSAPARDRIAPFLFGLTDTREGRDEPAEVFAFLNDGEKTVSDDVVHALHEYDVVPALWSQREKHVDALVG